MKNLIIIINLIIFPLFVTGSNVDTLFNIDKSEINCKFSKLDSLEQLINNKISISNLDLNWLNQENDKFYNPLIVNSIFAPWNLPSFWFTFILAAAGTYTLYGAGLGPVAFAIVYLSTKGQKSEIKKSAWGCVTGTLLGAGVKFFVYQFSKP